MELFGGKRLQWRWMTLSERSEIQHEVVPRTEALSRKFRRTCPNAPSGPTAVQDLQRSQSGYDCGPGTSSPAHFHISRVSPLEDMSICANLLNLLANLDRALADLEASSWGDGRRSGMSEHWRKQSRALRRSTAPAPSAAWSPVCKDAEDSNHHRRLPGRSPLSETEGGVVADQ